MRNERAFRVGLVLSIVVGLSAVALGVRGSRRFAILEGISIGNKQLVCYRDGIDFRVATIEFGVFPGDPVVAGEVYREWGSPGNWLKIPGFDVSLWWAFGLSLVMPVIWVLRRRTRGGGFAVVMPEGKSVGRAAGSS